MCIASVCGRPCLLLDLNHRQRERCTISSTNRIRRTAPMPAAVQVFLAVSRPVIAATAPLRLVGFTLVPGGLPWGERDWCDGRTFKVAARVEWANAAEPNQRGASAGLGPLTCLLSACLISPSAAKLRLRTASRRWSEGGVCRINGSLG